MGNGLDIDLIEINDFEDAAKAIVAEIEDLKDLQKQRIHQYSDVTGVSSQDITPFKQFEVDLSKKHDLKPITKPGSLILIEELDGKADLYLDKDKNEPIPLQHHRTIPVPETFQKFYVSNEAQKDGLTLKGAVTALGALDIEDTPSKVDPVHLDQPWGDFDSIQESSITVGADSEVTLDQRSGFGWIMFFVIKTDYSDIKLRFRRDGKLAYPEMSVNDLANTYGLDKANNLPRVTANDPTNNEFVMVLDPPDPFHFNDSFEIAVYNPDTSGHNVTDFAEAIVI